MQRDLDNDVQVKTFYEVIIVDEDDKELYSLINDILQEKDALKWAKSYNKPFKIKTYNK